MPCMITGRIGGDGGRVVGDEERSALAGDVLQALPLDAEPVPVHRVVDRAGDLAQALAPTPRVDVSPPQRRVAFGLGLRHRHELGALRRGLDVEVVGLPQMDRGRLLVALVGHVTKETASRDALQTAEFRRPARRP